MKQRRQIRTDIALAQWKCIVFSEDRQRMHNPRTTVVYGTPILQTQTSDGSLSSSLPPLHPSSLSLSFSIPPPPSYGRQRVYNITWVIHFIIIKICCRDYAICFLSLKMVLGLPKYRLQVTKSWEIVKNPNCLSFPFLFYSLPTKRGNLKHIIIYCRPVPYLPH